MIIRTDELELAIKVIIVGNGAVGKSSLIQRYCKGIFTKNYKKTIGVDFLEKHVKTENEDVRLMLWDTAGQEEFDAITRAYYRGAQACIIAFSTIDRYSFLDVRKWRKKVYDECGNIPTVIIQNKIDLIEQSEIKSEEIDILSRDHHLRVFNTSVKNDINVENVFNFLVQRHLDIINQPEQIFSADVFGNPDKLKKGDTITLSIQKKKSRKKKIIKSFCKII